MFLPCPPPPLPPLPLLPWLELPAAAPRPWLAAEVCSSCRPFVATTLTRGVWWNSDLEFRIISASVLNICTASCTCLERQVEWHWIISMMNSASWLLCSRTQCFHNALFSLLLWSPCWCSTPRVNAFLPVSPSYEVFFPSSSQCSVCNKRYFFYFYLPCIPDQKLSHHKKNTCTLRNSFSSNRVKKMVQI